MVLSRINEDDEITTLIIIILTTCSIETYCARAELLLMAE